MERSSGNFQLLSDNRKFQAIFASPNRYFTENSRRWVPLKQGPQHLITATGKTVVSCFQRLFKLFLDNSNSFSLFKGGKISQKHRIKSGAYIKGGASNSHAGLMLRCFTERFIFRYILGHFLPRKCNLCHVYERIGSILDINEENVTLLKGKKYHFKVCRFC